MRTTTLIAGLLALLLLLTPLALADGDRARWKAKHDALEREHDTDDDEDDDREEAREERRDRREKFRAAWMENRTALFDRFLAGVQALRASWHENATAVREVCHAQVPDMANATEDEREDAKHCIRDGYREWRAIHREEIRELHAQFHALMGGWHKGGRHAS